MEKNIWAIRFAGFALGLLLALSILYYVMPIKLTGGIRPDTCTFGETFLCHDWHAETNGISFALSQHTGNVLVVNSISCAPSTPGVWTKLNVSLESAQQLQIQHLICYGSNNEPLSLTRGDFFKAKLFINYSEYGVNNSHLVYGDIATTVK